MSELRHYGVKGMKWGVRKELKKQARANTKVNSLLSAEGARYVSREISEQEYNSLSGKPIKISKPGEDFQRISKTPNALRDSMVYVTKDPEDHKTYTALFPPEANGANRDKYSLTIRSADAIVSPSRKERIDAFIETLDKPVLTMPDGVVATGRNYLLGLNEGGNTKALSNREVGLKYYQAFAQSQHANHPLNQKFIENIKSRGYNSIVDDADQGMLSRQPIIIFPEKSNLTIVEAKPITPDDVLKAKATYKLPTSKDRA